MNDLEYMIKGKKVIGSGTRRIVYDLGNGTVLKVARSKPGIENNRVEVNLYKRARYPIKSHLAVIFEHACDYRWLIMEKHTRKLPHTKKYRQRFSNLRSEFMRYGIVPHDMRARPMEPNYKNLRLKSDGEIVVIDYGDFKIRQLSNF